MALRLAFLALVAASASTAVLAHEGHTHGSSASAGSKAGSHHEDGGHADHSTVKNSTTNVPSPAPARSAAVGSVFSIVLPLSAAAITTIAAFH